MDPWRSCYAKEAMDPWTSCYAKEAMDPWTSGFAKGAMVTAAGVAIGRNLVYPSCVTLE